MNTGEIVKRIMKWFSKIKKKSTEDIIAQVRAQNLTYCGRPKLENLSKALLQVENNKIPGMIIEAGVALGGSAIVMSLLKSRQREIHLFDIFGLIPSPGEHDDLDSHDRYKIIASGKSVGLGGQQYYGYQDDLIKVVENNLIANGVNIKKEKVYFHPGLFKDTMEIKSPVALAHIDCDWYESIKTCLDKIEPNLTAGGVLVFDDYSSYRGAKKIIDERIASSSKYKMLFHDRSIGFEKVLQ